MEPLFDKIAAGEFKVLCNLSSGALEWDYDSSLPHLQQVYDMYWRGADGRIDFDRVEREVPKLAAGLTNNLLCIDVEGHAWGGLHPGCGDRDKWVRDDQEVKQLVGVIHRLLPDVNLGLHASCPHTPTWDLNGFHASRRADSSGKFWRRYLLATEFMEFQRSLAEQLDFYAPSFYWNSDWYIAHDNTAFMQESFTDEWGNLSPLFKQQRISSLQVWITTTIHTLQLIRNMLPRKPLICQVSVQWWTGVGPHKWDCPLQGELVPPSWMPRILEAVRPYCDAIEIWVQPDPDGVGGFTTQQYLDSGGWHAICDWASVS